MNKLKKKSPIISKFISKEITAVYGKYKKLSKLEVKQVEDLIRALEADDVYFYDPYRDFDTTSYLADILAIEEDIDLVKLYIFLNLELKLEADLEEVKECHEELLDKGYMQIKDYLFYLDYGIDSLESQAADILASYLEDAGSSK